MAPERRGANGFGYDPVFIPDAFEDDLTMAELSPEQKNRISHRNAALKLYIAEIGA
jgi:XTP/dITP diphosphohydrolase